MCFWSQGRMRGEVVREREREVRRRDDVQVLRKENIWKTRKMLKNEGKV